MDWSTEDYTRTYADTFYLPPPEADGGVHLLEDAEVPLGARPGPPRAPAWYAPGAWPPPAGHHGVRADHTAGRPAWRTGRREGFFASARSLGDREAVHAVAWDERPPHYAPSAGPEHAHLVPPPRPAALYLEPPMTASEGQVRSALPRERFGALGDAARDTAEAMQGMLAQIGGRLVGLEYAKLALLLVVVCLLAMLLAATGRQARELKTMLRDAMREVRPAG